MPYNAEPGKVAYVVASADVRHGAPAADDGYCGTAVKQKTPAVSVAAADRNLIKAGESYLLLIDKVGEVPKAPISGATKGALVYIAEADNTLSLAPAAGKIVLGKVASLSGERGTPADKLRVNYGQKVA